MLIGNLSLIGDLGDETVDSAGRKLPLVAIVTLGSRVLGDSSNYDEITNVPQVHTLAEGPHFSRFSRSVGLTWRDSLEWDIAVVELEAGTGGGLEYSTAAACPTHRPTLLLPPLPPPLLLPYFKLSP